jgi:hypothetical protein
MTKTTKPLVRIAGNSAAIRAVNILRTVKSPSDIKGISFIYALEHRIYREADSFSAAEEILRLLSNTPLKDIL